MAAFVKDERPADTGLAGIDLVLDRHSGGPGAADLPGVLVELAPVERDAGLVASREADDVTLVLAHEIRPRGPHRHRHVQLRRIQPADLHSNREDMGVRLTDGHGVAHRRLEWPDLRRGRRRHLNPQMQDEPNREHSQANHAVIQTVQDASPASLRWSGSSPELPSFAVVNKAGGADGRPPNAFDVRAAPAIRRPRSWPAPSPCRPREAP